MAERRPLLSRKKDLFYLVFFSLHIPIIFLNDAVSLYPSAYVPQVLTNNVDQYATSFGDRFFIDPPSWFRAYTWMEVLYHVPASLHAILSLWRDDNPKLPLHLLVFAVQTAITTFTCIADFLSWEGFGLEQKGWMCALYGPYLALAVFMAVDMYGRLDVVISKAKGVESVVDKKNQ